MELLEKDVPWTGIGDRIRSRQSAAIGRGLALGLPLLLLFGGLFAAADAIFRSLLVGAVPDLRHSWSHLLVAFGIGWLSAGLLRDLLATREEERVIAPAVVAIGRSKLRVGTTEIAVALASVDVLFLAFVAVQLRYLFGGRGLVTETVCKTTLRDASDQRHLAAFEPGPLAPAAASRKPPLMSLCGRLSVSRADSSTDSFLFLPGSAFGL